ncbi:putative serine/threonine-protein kinase nek2 [Cucumis melo var. makuwa]|uniref:Serine/threonine-protein kinase nek2 n=1 Tax=Cucumis melo var. makuwa TaxID=1194695 RepID=A0A5A7UVC5_CUCMM|nr:putative serine/threonine-protein kinase nek2 [Cucumis melo var. makuwa]
MDDLNEEVGVGELNATVEETPKELKRQRGPTIMFDVTRIRSLGDKKVVRYNEDEAPIELKDKIFTTVEVAFVIDPRSRKNVLQTAESSSNKQGQYDNDDIQQVVHKIDEISMNTDSSSVNRHCSNDVLTQALGTKEHNGRVRVVGGYVTPTTYFHSVKKTSKDEANILVENEELRRRVSELEAQIRSNLSTPLSAHGSCSRPIVLEGIEEKGKRIEVESLDKPKHKEKKGKEVMKMNKPELDVLKERDLIKMPTEKEVVCESTSTLPLALKSILRYAEKVMEKDSSITFSLPADLFGVSRKNSVLREDIVDLCNMNEVKMFTLVAYMMYLYSSVSGSKENMQYVFVDPSLISFGNTQESRIRNLCSILMVSKPDQVVLAPFNPGCPLQVGSTTCGYYVMKYMREIINRGSIVILDSIDTRKSYSQAELDEERVELVEFLGEGLIDILLRLCRGLEFR